MPLAQTILFLPLLSAALIMLVMNRSANVSALVATGSAIATFVLSLVALMGGPGPDTMLGTWLESGWLMVDMGLKNDALSQGMMVIVTGVGALVHVFSLAYMDKDEGKVRYFAGLSFFMFSMTGIVMANDFAVMFVFWELVGVSSYILIGHWYTRNAAAEAAKKAFITNRIGDFGFMIGILMLWAGTKHHDFAGVELALPGVGDGLVTAATLLIFCGTIGKSAQFPLHVWLPDAMEGPTPVSALIHAATMVAAGVYLLVRVSFLISASAAAAGVIAWIGGLTALMAALMATQQRDIKRILAYSTLSQLGYMVMAAGLGGARESMFHLYTHAWFKAGLFLGAGAIIHVCHHEQDIWKMGGLKDRMPRTFITFVIATAALIAVPFITSGWYSKEGILEVAWHQNKLLFVLAAFTALLTAFYMTRLIVVAFFGKARSDSASHAHEAPPMMIVPLLVLAFMGLVAGFAPVASRVLGPYVPEAHGFGVVAIVSILTLIIGAGGAWKLYHRRDSEPLSLKLLANKFYFDEIYAHLVRLGQDTVATVAKVFDGLFIDGLIVRGSASLATGAGQLLRRVQVGNLQGYAFLFGLGVLLVVYLALAR